MSGPVAMGSKRHRQQNHGAVKSCISDIKKSEFVALDLEFSGLFSDVAGPTGMQKLSVDTYFSKCIRSVPEFLPLQLGLCCMRRCGDYRWELRSHEFNLWPLHRRLFNADFQSLRFLADNAFDFNAFFEHGHAYMRIPNLGLPSQADTPTMAPVVGVVQALRSSKVTLIVHNGLLDLLHLYDKFIGELPESLTEFSKHWLEHFPLLYDTRHLAQVGRYNVMKLGSGLSLETLHEHLQSITHVHTIIDKAGPLPLNKIAHGSAGFDATLTAEVFLMEMAL